jgi:4Fe-4S ferredoxin
MVCPAEAITLKNIASSSVDKLNNSIEVDTSKCVYCGVCKRICPEDAIKEVCSTCMLREEIEVPEISGEAFIIENSCVSCSWCSEICPVDAITVTKPFEGKLELVRIVIKNENITSEEAFDRLYLSKEEREAVRKLL